MKKSAILSGCGQYRYQMTRIWDTNKGYLNFIMLNPSTADHEYDDPTTRRACRFARGFGYGGIIVTNLYAFRSPDPKHMLAQRDPCGPENWHHVQNAARGCRTICAAWGGNKPRRSKIARRLLLGDYKLKCLGTTKKGGQPKHPLYLPKTAKLKNFKLTEELI